MPIRLAADLPALFRIGRRPDPLDWPPVQFVGYGRYDDPEGIVSTLYAAVTRRTVFLETLDKFRVNPLLLALLADEFGTDASAISGDINAVETTLGTIAPDYFNKLIVRFRIASGRRWLDVRAPETQEHLRRILAREIAVLGFGKRFVLGDLLAHEHAVTQLIARWAIDNAFDGIAYSSCHDPSLTCWAIFEGTQLARLGEPEAIAKTDLD